jgi:6-phosphogluconolactonase/glucosamine-6-phosphate isomerase/deaminase
MPDNPYINEYRSSAALNRELARRIADEIRGLLRSKGLAVLLLDAAPALGDCYQLLSGMELEWTRVVGYQLAEWRGRTADDPLSGRWLLHERLVCRVPMAEFHGLRGEAANPLAVCANYAARLRTLPPDLAVISIAGDGVPGFPALAGEEEGREGVVTRGASLGLTLDALRACARILVWGDDRRRLFDAPGNACFRLV